MIDNKTIRKVLLADKYRKQVCINDRRVAATSLKMRSLAFLAGTFILAFAPVPLLTFFGLLFLTQSIIDYRRCKFQARIIRIHDEWYREHLEHFL